MKTRLRRREGFWIWIQWYDLCFDSSFWLMAAAILSTAVARLTHTFSIKTINCSSIRRTSKEATTSTGAPVAGVSYTSCALDANTIHGTKARITAALWRSTHCGSTRRRTGKKSAASSRVRIAVKFWVSVGTHIQQAWFICFGNVLFFTFP